MTSDHNQNHAGHVSEVIVCDACQSLHRNIFILLEKQMNSHGKE